MSPARPVAHSALAAVADALACPECTGVLRPLESRLRCERGHDFDIARQGYISLFTGSATKMTGDTAAMLDARAAFQGSGHFAPIADAVIGALAVPEIPTADPLILEVGAGTGYYLARVLDALPRARGIALDVSKFAGRRCARAHPRAAAVVADAWHGLPIRAATLDAVLSVFAPRNPAAVAGSLARHGRYVVVTPTPRHLEELIGPLDMVEVDPDKERRLAEGMTGYFELEDRTTVEYSMKLTPVDIARVVAMGPSAHHVSSVAEPIATTSDPWEVTASVTVRVYRHR